MQYLVRMITPVDGTVLDPFNGSGSTGKAAMLLKKYNYIGIDLSADYITISKARIENAINTTGKIIEDTAIDTEEEETNFFIEQ
jgi:site-specific DNA-methyltransferase (adenine-specific)